MSDKPIYSEEDFPVTRGWSHNDGVLSAEEARDYANALHERKCPYKARGFEDENGNEYAQVCAMKEQVAQLKAERDRLRESLCDLLYTWDRQTGKKLVSPMFRSRLAKARRVIDGKQSEE